ncbi:unnamed protein product [Lepidochelys olivacea]
MNAAKLCICLTCPPKLGLHPTPPPPLLSAQVHQLCVSRDYEMGHRYSVPFGGALLLQNREPPGGTHLGTMDDPYLKCCLVGFSQHLALISNSCQVEYCIQSGIFTGGALSPAQLPPYIRHDPGGH